jgi:L-fuconolactonase
VDTHLHFWDLRTYHRHDWLQKKPAIYRSFLPPDLKPDFDECAVDLGVIVEAARDSHALNLWWLRLTEEYDFLGAVIVGSRLDQDDLPEWLDEYSHHAAMRGVRSHPAGRPAEWPEQPETRRALRELTRRDLVLELLVEHDAFEAVSRLASQHPSLRIVVNHGGVPPFREGSLSRWARGMTLLAANPNVFLKYSSLLYYSGPDPSRHRLQPAVDVMLETFGPQRMLWGSNWPVELLAGSYKEAFRWSLLCVDSLSQHERAALFGGNAIKVYRIDSSRWARAPHVQPKEPEPV